MNEAYIKISQLPPASGITPSVDLVGQVGGQTKRIPLSSLVDGDTIQADSEKGITLNPDYKVSKEEVINLASKVDLTLSLADAEVIPTTYVKANAIIRSSQSWTSWKFLNDGGFLTSVKAKVWGNSTDIYAITFFDSEELLVSSIMPQSVFSADGFNEFIADVPVGCKMVIVSSRTASGSNQESTINNSDSVKKLRNDLTVLERASENTEISFDSVGSPYCFVNASFMAPSDMTWVGDSLVLINSQQGNTTDYDSEPQASIYVNKFANGIDAERTYIKRFYHKFGHANTIDYNKFNDCLILGNGSGSYTLDGDIIVIPNFSQLIDNTPADSIVTLADANALIIHCGAYNLGTKFNLVWGDDNDKEYNIAYLITANYGGSTSANGGDLEIIRKIVLCKGEEVGTYGTVVSNDTPFNGTFNIVGTWVQKTLGYPNCDQGTCYHNGEIFAAIGHDGLWYWRMRLGSDGKIYRKSFKQAQYGHTPNNVSGICIKDGFLFLGRQNVGVTAFDV